MPLITRVLQPERLNAVHMAKLAYEAAPLRVHEAFVPWVWLSQAQRTACIDQMQIVLDRLVASGVLGVNSPQARDVEPEAEPVEHSSEAPQLAMPGPVEETPR